MRSDDRGRRTHRVPRPARAGAPRTDDLVELAREIADASATPGEAAREVCALVYREVKYVSGSTDGRRLRRPLLGRAGRRVPGHGPHRDRRPALGRHPGALRVRLPAPEARARGRRPGRAASRTPGSSGGTTAGAASTRPTTPSPATGTSIVATGRDYNDVKPLSGIFSGTGTSPHVRRRPGHPPPVAHRRTRWCTPDRCRAGWDRAARRTRRTPALNGRQTTVATTGTAKTTGKKTTAKKSTPAAKKSSSQEDRPSRRRRSHPPRRPATRCRQQDARPTRARRRRRPPRSPRPRRRPSRRRRSHPPRRHRPRSPRRTRRPQLPPTALSWTTSPSSRSPGRPRIVWSER